MDSHDTIRIGTRASLLAVAQARLVAEGLVRVAGGGVDVELVPMATRGDRTAGPLEAVGGKGLFTAELEAALREGRVDLAVHSAKDLPAEMAAGAVIAAVPVRADARDVLVTREGLSLAELPRGAVVGTSSRRRGFSVLHERPDVVLKPLRGNVDTRLQKVLSDRDRDVDAVVLAMAGLERSGLAASHGACCRVLEVEVCIPAAGQGALAVQAAVDNSRACALAALLDDADSRAAVEAERAVVASLGGDCHSCIAVHARRVGEAGESGEWEILFLAAKADFSLPYWSRIAGASAMAASEGLMEQLRRDCVRERIGG